MEKVYFTIDSAGDLPDGFTSRYTDIEIIPLHIILGEDSFEDGVTITASDIIDYVEKTKTLPKTSAVTVGEYADIFTRLTGSGFSVVHIALSSNLSASYQSALIASEGFDNVHIVNSLLVSSSMALLLMKGCELREKGFSASQIALMLEKMKSKAVTSFIIDKLDYLHKGGRCSAVSAFGANALGIKLCIEAREGSLCVRKKYRGRLLQCQQAYIDDILTSYGSNIDGSAVILGYTPGLSPENEEILINQIKKNYNFKEILIAHPGCTITSHCGPNTAAVLFMINS